MNADPAVTRDDVAAGDAAFFGHPRALSTLFFTELWERFSYYGMRALLALFMVAPVAAGGLGLSTVEASRIYGNYTMAVYMLAIPGGFIADRFLGAKRAVLIGGVIMAAGHFMLAYGSLASFYTGLVAIAIGTGLFKPNISALVGGLYASEDARRDAGFSLFYMGINIGGFAAPLLTGFLAQSALFQGWLDAAGLDPSTSWHWGFASAGVGLTLGLIVYVLQADRLARVGEAPDLRRSADGGTLLVVAGTGALLGALLLSDVPGFTWLRGLLIALPVGAILWFGWQSDLDARRIAAVFMFFVAAMLFWAIFEQTGLTIAFFADRLMDNSLAGLSFPSAWVQSLNPLFVIFLAPLFAWAWLRLGTRQPSAPIKFTLGLFFLSLSFLLMVPAAYLTATGKVSPLWLAGVILLQTIGELLLSPVGLSTMTKLAPARTVGLILGLWFLATAFGNKLAGILGEGYDGSDPAKLADFFLHQALMVGAATILLLLLTPWLKRLMGGVR